MTERPRKNPFRPGVGVRPLYLAGRDGPLRRFSAMLRAAPEQPASMRVTGLRGVGKTVLLDVFAERARDANWEPAFLELQPSHNTDGALGTALGSLLERARERLARLARLRSAAGKALAATSLSVTWEDVSLSLSFGSEREEDLARNLFETVELALARGRAGLVLLLDEAQLIRDERDRHGEHPLSLLIAPVVALQRRELPLGLVVCGLPTLTANLQKARSYSERMFRGEDIDSLDREEALAAFTRPLEQTRRKADRAVARAVAEEVEGYPYFLQLWGSEQDLLLASTACSYPPLRSADLSRASSRTAGNVNVLLGRLVDAGALYRIRKGEYAYTAPKFRDYLLRRVGGG
jgi:hypothetical protein